MKKTKKIGWQKYENVLEEQIQNPLIVQHYKTLQQNLQSTIEEDVLKELSDEELQMLLESGEDFMQPHTETVHLPVDENMIENATLASNFDCWMGYTNFNITEDVKEELNKTEGVEVLKIVSRYRFFVGIGKMFNFKEVRKDIEENLTDKGN